MDPRLDRLFSSLEAQFGAAVARAEEEAADDLALSLRQDVPVKTLLRNGMWQVATGTEWEPVCEVAKDHVRTASGRLIPFSEARLRRGSGPRPTTTNASVAQVLRQESRRRREVVLALRDQTIVGHPISCGDTHVLVRSQKQEYLLPLSQICRIKLSHGDSVDVS